MAAPTFTDQGSNTLRCSATEALLRASDSDTVTLIHYIIAQQDVTIPADTTRYVGIEYNSGSPQYVVKTADTWDWNTDFRVAICYNEGGTIHIRSVLHRSVNFQRWANQRLYEVERIKHQTGLTLSESAGANRYVTMTAGALYSSLEKYTLSAFDSAVGNDRFDVYYRDGGSSFTKVASQQSWDPDSYDDDSGTLADMTADYYANLWFYIETDGHVVCLYGRGEYLTIAEAVAENPPNTLPDRLDVQGILLGRYVFQKSATDPVQVDTAFPPAVGGGTADDHGALVGLGDDDHGQYALLAGRTGGQRLYGGASSNVSLGAPQTTGQVTIFSLVGSADQTVASFRIEAAGTAGIDFFRDLNMNTYDIYGGSGSGGNLDLHSTEHASKGVVTIDGSTAVTAANISSYVDLSDYLNKDGSVALTGDWDAGSFDITAEQLVSDSTAVSEGVSTYSTFIGNWAGGNAYATFCHNSLKGVSTSYALIQHASGDTYFNAAPGRSFWLMHGGSLQVAITAANVELTNANLDMNNNDIYAVDDITGNGGSIISGGTGSGDDLLLKSTTHATTGDITLDGEYPLLGKDDSCRVWHNADQSINNVTWTALAMNQESFDPNTLHDTVTNNSRITIATAGRYIVGGFARFEPSADRTFQSLSISINGVPGTGTEIARSNSSWMSAAGNQAGECTVVGMWDLAASDYIELCAYQSTGGALDVDTFTSFSPALWCQRVE